MVSRIGSGRSWTGVETGDDPVSICTSVPAMFERELLLRGPPVWAWFSVLWMPRSCRLPPGLDLSFEADGPVGGTSPLGVLGRLE